MKMYKAGEREGEAGDGEVEAVLVLFCLDKAASLCAVCAVQGCLWLLNGPAASMCTSLYQLK